jgi:transposase
MARVIFKPDNQNQQALFPLSYDALIPSGHPVRLVNEIIDKLDITEILTTYKGGGSSSYHPRVLLKLLIYSYLNNTYSSRKIEKACKESINYLWLSGLNFPDHNTINTFRGRKLKEEINNIFAQVVTLLNESGIISLKETFTDGTKIESVANRYTFVWKGSIEKNKERLENKIKVVIKEIEKAIDEDNNTTERPDPSGLPISSVELDKKIEELNQKLSQKNAAKKIVKQAEKLRTESLPKLQEYERHLRKMGERNSYSKTDPDATFMRMKEDHMKNGQLKPAYNVQLSTEHNFITNYSIHQRPGDTATFKDHLQSYHDKYAHYPDLAVADAGYGSAENYEFLDKNGIESFVKYNYFHKEQSRKFKLDISRVENLYYNATDDYYICPMGQKMQAVGKAWRESELGYKYEVVYYQAKNCSSCPLNGACHKQKGNRRIEVNKKLNLYKQKTRENLMSDEGRVLRGRRCTEVEQTFGQIKWNKKFNRFLLRSLPKVSIEIGLIAIAHNLQKLSMVLGSGKLAASLCKNMLLLCQYLNRFFMTFFKKSTKEKKKQPKIIFLSNWRKAKEAA